MATKKIPKASGLSQLAIDKLASSGLTPDDAAALHIDYASADDVVKIHAIFKPLPSIIFNYIDPRAAYGTFPTS